MEKETKRKLKLMLDNESKGCNHGWETRRYSIKEIKTEYGDHWKITSTHQLQLINDFINAKSKNDLIKISDKINNYQGKDKDFKENTINLFREILKKHRADLPNHRIPKPKDGIYKLIYHEPGDEPLANESVETSTNPATPASPEIPRSKTPTKSDEPAELKPEGFFKKITKSVKNLFTGSPKDPNNKKTNPEEPPPDPRENNEPEINKNINSEVVEDVPEEIKKDVEDVIETVETIEKVENEKVEEEKQEEEDSATPSLTPTPEPSQEEEQQQEQDKDKEQEENKQQQEEEQRRQEEEEKRKQEEEQLQFGVRLKLLNTNNKIKIKKIQSLSQKWKN